MIDFTPLVERWRHTDLSPWADTLLEEIARDFNPTRYGDLPAVFTKVDDCLADRNVPPESFFEFRCSNNVFGAVFLLWALARQRKILLTPPEAGHTRQIASRADAPHFCRHLVSIDFDPAQAELHAPESYLRIDSNPSYREESAFAEPESLVCLKTSGSMAYRSRYRYSICTASAPDFFPR